MPSLALDASSFWMAPAEFAGHRRRAPLDPEIVRGIIRYVKAQDTKDIVVGEGSVETEYESTPYNFHYAGRCCVAEKGVGLGDLE